MDRIWNRSPAVGCVTNEHEVEVRVPTFRKSRNVGQPGSFQPRESDARIVPKIPVSDRYQRGRLKVRNPEPQEVVDGHHK